MARDLDGTSQTLSNASAGNYTSSDFTIALWIYPDDVTTDDVLIFKGGYNSVGYYIQFARFPAAAGSLSIVTNQSGANQATASADSVFTTGAWQHVAFVRSGSSIKIYRNGAEVSYGSTGTHTDPASSSNDFRIGGYNTGFQWNGRVAECALYGAALSAAEVASLGAGFSPLLVRPGSLDNYWPLLGRTDPEIDVVGGQALTINSSAPQISHPRVIYPRRRQVGMAGSAASYSTSRFRENAGVGALGGGPFSHANAGLGVVA